MVALFVGRSAENQRELFGAEAKRAGLPARFVADAEAACHQLTASNARVPHCIFLARTMPDWRDFVAWIRGQPQLFQVPVFVIARDVSDQTYREAYLAGADDVLFEGAWGACTRRAAVAKDLDPVLRPPTNQGVAVVVHADGRRRALLGRVLRQAGFDPTFAAASSDLTRPASASSRPRVAVTQADPVERGGAHVAGRIRTVLGQDGLPILVLGNDPDLELLRHQAGALNGVEIAAESAPPDELLFMTNEALRTQFEDKRASPRLLYPTLCSFRVAGELLPSYGFVYNASREGFFIKTYDAPRTGAEVWLELRPPGQVRAVRLTVRSVWTRLPTHERAAIVPPGFGARLVDERCASDDHQAWLWGYETLLEQQRRYDLTFAA